MTCPHWERSRATAGLLAKYHPAAHHIATPIRNSPDVADHATDPGDSEDWNVDADVVAAVAEGDSSDLQRPRRRRPGGPRRHRPHLLTAKPARPLAGPEATAARRGREWQLRAGGWLRG